MGLGVPELVRVRVAVWLGDGDGGDPGDADGLEDADPDGVAVALGVPEVLPDTLLVAAWEPVREGVAVADAVHEGVRERLPLMLRVMLRVCVTEALCVCENVASWLRVPERDCVRDCDCVSVIVRVSVWLDVPVAVLLVVCEDVCDAEPVCDTLGDALWVLVPDSEAETDWLADWLRVPEFV